MTNPASYLFFFLFALVLLGMYIAIRRRLARPLFIVVGGVVISVAAITLAALSESNTIYQALLSGIVVGGLFSAGTLALAWYFQGVEQRSQAGSGAPPPDAG